MSHLPDSQVWTPLGSKPQKEHQLLSVIANPRQRKISTVTTLTDCPMCINGTIHIRLFIKWESFSVWLECNLSCSKCPVILLLNQQGMRLWGTPVYPHCFTGMEEVFASGQNCPPFSKFPAFPYQHLSKPTKACQPEFIWIVSWILCALSSGECWDCKLRWKPRFWQS